MKFLLEQYELRRPAKLSVFLMNIRGFISPDLYHKTWEPKRGLKIPKKVITYFKVRMRHLNACGIYCSACSSHLSQDIFRYIYDINNKK